MTESPSDTTPHELQRQRVDGHRLVVAFRQLPKCLNWHQARPVCTAHPYSCIPAHTVFEAIYAQADVVGAAHLGVGRGEREEDELARRHIPDGAPRTDLCVRATVRHGDLV